MSQLSTPQSPDIFGTLQPGRLHLTPSPGPNTENAGNTPYHRLIDLTKSSPSTSIHPDCFQFLNETRSLELSSPSPLFCPWSKASTDNGDEWQDGQGFPLWSPSTASGAGTSGPPGGPPGGRRPPSPPGFTADPRGPSGAEECIRILLGLQRLIANLDDTARRVFGDQPDTLAQMLYGNSVLLRAITAVVIDFPVA